MTTRWAPNSSRKYSLARWEATDSDRNSLTDLPAAVGPTRTTTQSGPKMGADVLGKTGGGGRLIVLLFETRGSPPGGSR